MYSMFCLFLLGNPHPKVNINNDLPSIRSAAVEAKALGTQLHINVEVAKDLRQQPVLIEPRNASPTDLLQSLAFALHATLIHEGNVTRIVRTKADRDSLKALDLKIMESAILATEQRWDAELKDVAKFGNQAAQVAHLLHADAETASLPQTVQGTTNVRGMDPALATPAGHLLRSLVNQLPLDILAGIGPGESKTFSSAPTPTEIGIPKTDALLQQFSQEQNAYSRDPALKISDEDKQKSREAFVLPSQQKNLQGLKCLLNAKRDLDNLLVLVAAVFNADGSLIAYAGILTVPSRDNVISYQRAAIAASQHKDAVIELTPEQLTLEKAFRPPYTPLPTTDPLWARIVHPELYDPANVLVPTALDSWLNSDERPVVAVIPDDLTKAAQYCLQNLKLNTAAFEALLPDSSEKTELGGVRILRPRDPLCSDQHNCDRVALGLSLRRFLAQGQIDLRGWSVLHYQQGRSFSLIPQEYAGVMRRTTQMPTFTDPSSRSEIFEMLGAIPDERWQPLENGGVIELSEDWLTSMLADYISRYIGEIGQVRSLPAIKQIATEYFPDGIPSDAKLTIRTRPALSLRSFYKSDSKTRVDMTIPARIGMEFDGYQAMMGLRRKADPKFVPESGPAVLDQMLRKNLIIPCVRTETEAVFEISPGFSFSATFLSLPQEVGPANVFSRLPEEYRKAMYEEWARLESQKTGGQ